MKPSVGREVWCIYRNELYKHYVGYVGKDSFIIDGWNEGLLLNAVEYMYDEYQHSWFTCLARAKKELLAIGFRTCEENETCKLVKRDEDYYELRYYHDTRKESAK